MILVYLQSLKREISKNANWTTELIVLQLPVGRQATTIKAAGTWNKLLIKEMKITTYKVLRLLRDLKLWGRSPEKWLKDRSLVSWPESINKRTNACTKDSHVDENVTGQHMTVSTSKQMNVPALWLNYLGANKM